MVKTIIVGMSGATIFRIIVALISFTIFSITFGYIGLVQGGYTKCTLGKGISSKLYNCGTKYNDGNDQSNLEQQTTPNSYLIRLKSGVAPTEVDDICNLVEADTTYSGYCSQKFKKVWLGMLIVISGEHLVQLLNVKGDEIDQVEVEGTLRLAAGVTQKNPANWGLDRIDHQIGDSYLDQLYNVTATGEGVHIYVLDTGIRCSHQEFLYQDGRKDKSGTPLRRCLAGFDGIGDGQGTNDCNGHGTHCAGIAAGLRNGVAKHAFVHPVRAMGCDGSGGYGAIMAALEWIGKNQIRPAVVSMSIATQASISIDQAVNNLVNHTGIIAIAASGNFVQAACNYSPSRASSVISVGSSTKTNTMSWFSNFGKCMTIFAPGELILSSYKDSDTTYTILSGTSMACPHVAGASALYLEKNPDARPAEVRKAIIDAAESNAISNTKPETSTKLLNVNFKDPLVDIHPASFYNASEGTSLTATIGLRVKPNANVILTPTLSDYTLGRFQPSQLTFGTGSRWSDTQTITLVLNLIPDFLDHSVMIRWSFTSTDKRFVVIPEGFLTSRDTAVCRQTPNNPCGQSIAQPKIIPSLPFYYEDDTSNYKNIYDSDFDSCHSSGPDTVFQFTAIETMVVNISLCGDTEFDTLLSVYEKTAQTVHQLACNDDACNAQSMIPQISFVKGHVYIIMVDGFGGDQGPFDIYVKGPNDKKKSTTKFAAFSTSKIHYAMQADPLVVCTNWKLKGGCEMESQPPILVQDTTSEYSWSPVGWGLCDKPCGGGNKHAVMQCYDKDLVPVNASFCDYLPLPQLNQSCNNVACQTYKLFKGPWSECNQTCGSGSQFRELVCVDNFGNIADISMCSKLTLDTETRSCNPQACNSTYWRVPNWNFCNVPCAGGFRFRDSICMQNETIVDDALCIGDPPRVQSRCNDQPCATYAWLVGHWSRCPSECNATVYRVVECVDGEGDSVIESLCDPLLKPASSTNCEQVDPNCDNCNYNNCSGNGKCVAGQCTCSSQWEGQYCDRPIVCKGKPMGYLPNGNVSCCPFKTIDAYQHCCANNASKLDQNGFCCESGNLDACGVCDGKSKSLDSQNTCCPTVRDEKGICCKSGVLDECHICNGDGTSCGTNVTILTEFINATMSLHVNGSSIWKDFMISFVQSVSSRLGVQPSAVLLNSMQISNSLSMDCTTNSEDMENCMNGGTSLSIGVFKLTILPVPLTFLRNMHVKKNDARSSLMQATFLESEDNDMFDAIQITDVINIQRFGICGNGMCEKGERCDKQGNSASSDKKYCCLKDCPYVPNPCPVPTIGPKAGIACAGNGHCLDASGQCDCFLGYAGIDCSYCAIGWVSNINETCRKVADLHVTQKLATAFVNPGDSSLPGSITNSKKNIIIIASSIGSATLLAIISIIAFKVWQRSGDDIDLADASFGVNASPMTTVSQIARKSIQVIQEGSEKASEILSNLSKPSVAMMQDGFNGVRSSFNNGSSMDTFGGSSNSSNRASFNQSIPRKLSNPSPTRRSILVPQPGATGWRKSLMPQQLEYELVKLPQKLDVEEGPNEE